MIVVCTNCEAENNVSDVALQDTNEPCSSCRFPLILSNRYIAVRVIGRGGFGQTFRAIDRNLRRDCVIKRLKPPDHLDRGTLEQIQRRFEAEASILYDLNHKRIPRIYDYFQIRDLFYIVQDYIPGRNLLEELQARSAPFSKDEVKTVLDSILKVLDYLHTEANNQRGIIHRDIKPANIIQHESDKTLHLIDFGTVRRVEQQNSGQSIVLVTPGYSPPEQFDVSGEIDPSSDLYALAVSCIHLLTNRDPQSYINRHRFDRKWRQYASEDVRNSKLADILDRMRQIDQNQRYHSAAAVLQDLKPSLWERFRNWGAQIPTQFRHCLSRRRHRWTLLIAIVALLIILLFRPFSDFVMGFFPQPEPSISERMSWGEKSVLQGEQQKLNGTDAFGKLDFGEAIKEFQDTLKSNSNNPEAWIYLNNAIAREVKRKRKTRSIYIAVALPKGDGKNPEEILRGVAHRQNIFNCGDIASEQKLLDFRALKDPTECGGRNGRFLEIGIAPYDETSIDRTTDAILDRKEILGVVGRYSSNDIGKIGERYASKKLVMIAPTSNSRRSDLNPPLNSEYIFRLIPDVSLTVKEISEKISKKAKFDERIAIFRTQSPYGQSIIKTFVDIFKSENLLDLGTSPSCQLSSKSPNVDQNIEQCFSRRIIDKVKTIVVAPDLGDIHIALNLMKYVYKKQLNLNVYGLDTLYEMSLLERYKSLAQNQVEIPQVLISVPWTREESDSIFLEISNRMWKNSLINWRTVMSYDAVQVLIQGLEKANYKRDQLSRVLSNNFSGGGQTGEIKFKNGDREHRSDLNSFVKIVKEGNSYNFQRDKLS